MWLLGTEAVRRADRAAIEAGLSGLTLMETAGRTAAALLLALAAAPDTRHPAVVLAGGGNNGGDGLVLARWLARWTGPEAVRVYLAADPARLRGEAAVQWRLLLGAGIPARSLAGQAGAGEGPPETAGAGGVAPAGGVAAVGGAAGAAHPQQARDGGRGDGHGDEDAFLTALRSDAARASVAVDALLGVGTRGGLRPLAAVALQALAAGGAPILALDLPSGLDPDTGRAAPETPRARWTVTFGAAKWGLVLRDGPSRAGQVFVADIGWPDPPVTPAGELGDAGRPRFATEEPAAGSAGGRAEEPAEEPAEEQAEEPGAGPAAGPAGEPAEPPPARVIDARLARRLLPRRPPDAHKGTAGHVTVIGGRVGQAGAPLLAARAALRSGAGTVTVAVPEAVRPEVAAQEAALMTLPLPGRDGEVAAEAAGAVATLEAGRGGRRARVIGPGLGRGRGTAACLERLLGWAAEGAAGPTGHTGAGHDDPGVAPGDRARGDAAAGQGTPSSGTAGEAVPAVAYAVPPTVLDADALNLVAEAGIDRLRYRRGPFPLVLTPHPGEAARLLGCSAARIQADRPGSALRLAERSGAVVVLKGHGTLVADPDGRLYFCSRGNPGMATAGMGDALAGVIGALLAQGLGPLEAAVLGVYLHALAGDLAAAEALGAVAPEDCARLTAGDVIDRLPQALALCARGLPDGRAARGVPGVEWLRPPVTSGRQPLPGSED